MSEQSPIDEKSAAGSMIGQKSLRLAFLRLKNGASFFAITRAALVHRSICISQRLPVIFLPANGRGPFKPPPTLFRKNADASDRPPPQTVVLAAFANLFVAPATVHAAAECKEAGQTQYAEQTTIWREGAATTPLQGKPICQGDRIVTGTAGEFHGKLADGGYIALSSSTEFRVDKFQGADTEDDGIALTIVRGTLRVMTGWVSKLRPKTFTLTVPTATIGVRGTDF